MRTAQFVLALLVSLTGTYSMALEEPDYTVLKTTPDYEIRRYEPYIVAEVDVQGDFEGSGKAAFSILAGYIFGANHSREKMKMTAPVESGSVRMAMTAPVISYVANERSGEPDHYAYFKASQKKIEEGATGAYTYAFVMEKQYTLETLPAPDDSSIRFRSKPSRVVAVRRYSGRWTAENYSRNADVLMSALRRDGLAITGEPRLARYNSPFVPWFLRRNEVMAELGWTGDAIQGTKEGR
jgi:hypothetical protein